MTSSEITVSTERLSIKDVHYFDKITAEGYVAAVTLVDPSGYKLSVSGYVTRETLDSLTRYPNRRLMLVPA